MTYDNPGFDTLSLGGTTDEGSREVEREEKQRREDRLIPTGTYEGQVVEWKPQVPERGIYQGETVARVTVDLFGVGEAMVTRKHFFSIAGIDRRNESGEMAVEHRLATQMARATHTVGKPLIDTLNEAMRVRLRYRVRKGEATERYDARNWTDAITATR